MPVHNTRDEFDSLHILEGVSRIEEGGHEVMASLDHIDAGEAVIGQAKTPIRKAAACTLLNSRSNWLHYSRSLKMLFPTDPDFKFPFPPARSLDFEINVIPHEKIPSKVVYKMSPIEQEL
jgi:hypothetical protein